LGVSVQPSVEKILYDRKSAACALSISVRSLDYVLAARQLETVKIGKKVLIPASELRRYARGNHFGPINPANQDLRRAA
jgi:hypothetical protein